MYQQIVEEASREQLRQRRGFLRRMKLFHGLDKVNLTTVAQCCSDIRFGGERGGSGIFTQDQHSCEAHNKGQDQDQAATKEVSISVSSNDLLCKSATLQALLTIRALHTPLHSLRSHTPPAAGTARHRARRLHLPRAVRDRERAASPQRWLQRRRPADAHASG